MPNLTRENFAQVVATIKTDISATQIRTIQQVNSNLILLYFRIGKILSENSKYGNSLLRNVSVSIQTEWPGIKGFSERNLERMRQFYNEYKDELTSIIDKSRKYDVISAQAVAKLGNKNDICQHYTLKLTWGHNIALIEKIKDKKIRQLYAEAAIKNGWSRNILELQIKSEYHKRIGKSANNFKTTLPPENSDLTNDTFKDPYIFDFIRLKQGYKEADLETAMLEKIKRLLLELGKGFSFVGSQYKITAGETDYYLDLLFYHIELRCYVVVELKSTDFKPEYIGQLNFYITAIDKTLKHPDDNNTIGLLLCKDKDKVSTEWALEKVGSPIGVSSYEIAKYLPTEEELNLHIAENSLKNR